jgi:hypothetical protein
MLDKEFRQLKQEYHAWVLHYIVRSQLDAARVTGLKVGEDMPHYAVSWNRDSVTAGQARGLPGLVFYPDVINIVADNPEQSLLLATYAADNCECKCQRCERESEDMGKTGLPPAV